MAIGFDISSESAVSTATPKTWSHAATGTPDWVLVFGFQEDDSTDQLAACTYDGITLDAVSGGFAADTVTELGTCKAYFKDGGAWGSGTKTVSLSRGGTSVVFYGVAISGNGTDAEVYTSGILLEQENQALAEENIDDGSPGTNSMRFVGLFSGRAPGTPPAAGASSTLLQNAGTLGGNAIHSVVRETTAGEGSRPVGFSVATSDDVAAVYLAVRETPAGGGGGGAFTGWGIQIF